MFDVELYTYTGERNRLNKTLEDPTTLHINFNTDYNPIHPTLKIVGRAFPYNYFYIPELQKYYFIDNAVEKRANMWECSCTLDVLMTYKEYILTLSGTVTQSKTGLYLRGVDIPVTSKPTIDKYNFNGDNFTLEGTFVLVGV